MLLAGLKIVSCDWTSGIGEVYKFFVVVDVYSIMAGEMGNGGRVCDVRLLSTEYVTLLTNKD